jgi:myo-inositol 2-dehydrogenase / D-chiro-inositol 1-dehydrogenase
MRSGVFRLGLIGAGRMGQTHLRALAASRRVSVTAIVEPLESLRTSRAGPSIDRFATVEELLAAGGIDGALVAAPSDRHVEIVAKLAAGGVPILCEKPCGVGSRDVRLAARAAEEHGVPLQIGYWRRFVPALQALRRRIADGELGDVHLIACYQWDERPPAPAFRAHSGGIFVDMGVHEFDQMRWLSGQEIGSVRAVASALEVDPEVITDVDSAQALVELSGGGTGVVSLGRHHPAGDMVRVEVFGTRDTVRCDVLDPRDGEMVQLDALRRQAEGFAEFASGGRPSGASVVDAIAALEAAERASDEIRNLHPVAEVRQP